MEEWTKSQTSLDQPVYNSFHLKKRVSHFSWSGSLIPTKPTCFFISIFLKNLSPSHWAKKAFNCCLPLCFSYLINSNYHQSEKENERQDKAGRKWMVCPLDIAPTLVSVSSTLITWSAHHLLLLFFLLILLH